jgi:hypothetical protein
MWNKFTEGFWDNFYWILLGLLFVFIAGTFYALGSESRTNKLCKQLGGVYVQTWSDGHTCIMATEISLK